tara:strand:- start:159 stop:851 length:693 start_codon:yes stop_codon:yes gene_type:complete
MANIENLFAFDFDDTLAITTSSIGVRRITADGKSDPGFRDWIIDNDLDIEDIENPDSDEELIWFSSGDFSKYEKAHRADLDYLSVNSFKDEYDFSKVKTVDLEGTVPVNSILNILKQAQNSSDSKVVIITARAGNQNQTDIQDFLTAQGIDLRISDITTAGDLGAGPSAKVAAMDSYIKAYSPKNIFFYDDNQGNISAIAGMCEKYFPEISIKTFTVDENGNATLTGGCW